MSTKKNAAKTAVVAAALPTVGQIQVLACRLMEDCLVRAGEHFLDSGNWPEDQRDSINAAELALDSVKWLASRLPLDFDEFTYLHCRIQSTISLAAAAFPDKSTPTWRWLRSAESGFSDVLYAMEIAEQAEIQVSKIGGAA